MPFNPWEFGVPGVSAPKAATLVTEEGELMSFATSSSVRDSSDNYTNHEKPLLPLIFSCLQEKTSHQSSPFNRSPLRILQDLQHLSDRLTKQPLFHHEHWSSEYLRDHSSTTPFISIQSIEPYPIEMATIQVREATQQLVKRQNWAAREPGVIVVFAIVFIVASGLIGLQISRWISRHREKQAAKRSIVWSKHSWQYEKNYKACGSRHLKGWGV